MQHADGRHRGLGHAGVIAPELYITALVAQHVQARGRRGGAYAGIAGAVHVQALGVSVPGDPVGAGDQCLRERVVAQIVVAPHVAEGGAVAVIPGAGRQVDMGRDIDAAVVGGRRGGKRNARRQRQPGRPDALRARDRDGRGVQDLVAGQVKSLRGGMPAQAVAGYIAQAGAVGVDHAGGGHRGNYSPELVAPDLRARGGGYGQHVQPCLGDFGAGADIAVVADY